MGKSPIDILLDGLKWRPVKPPKTIKVYVTCIYCDDEHPGGKPRRVKRESVPTGTFIILETCKDHRHIDGQRYFYDRHGNEIYTPHK